MKNLRKTLLSFAALSSAISIAACTLPPPEEDNSGGTGGSTGASTSASGSATSAGGQSTGTGGTTLPNAGPPYGHPKEGFDYPTHDGFQLWLVEEFDAPLDLDTDPIWTWSDGGLDEGQVRFVKEGITFSDGAMNLVVSSEPPATKPKTCSHAEVKTVFSKPYTSGEFRSRLNLFRYGRYEARIKAPTVQPGNTTINGNYIATMFVFRTPKFEDWREIDIEVTGDAVNSLTTNILKADNAFNWSADIQDVQSFTLDGANVREEYHDYAFEWLPDRVTWYFDGKVVREHKAGSGIPISDKSAKIMMNLWVFNSSVAFGGKDLANNQYPLKSSYDWFRFYRADIDSNYPCEAMNESCLAAEDLNLSSNNPCDGLPSTGLVNGKEACAATCN